MSKRLHIVSIVVWALTSLVPLAPSPALAASFNYDTKVTYRVNADGTTNVTEAYSVTNNTARQYLTELKITTPTDKVSEVRARYSDGGVIPATTAPQTNTRGDIKVAYQEINLAFPRQIYGQSRRWSFTLTYLASGLVDTKGGAHTVYVPSIEAGEPGDNYSVTVDVPIEFGTAHFAGAVAASGGVSANRQFYNFAKKDLVAQALALAFGDQTVYKLNFNFPLVNDGILPRTFTVTLPPDLSNQRSVVDKISPKPDNLRLDEDGNVLADYRLNPGQKVTVTTDVYGEANYLEYDLSASRKKGDIPADLAKRYTKATQYWPTTGPVADQAKKLVDNDAPVVNNVKAIYSFVIDKLSYNNDKIKFNIRQGAAAALANPTNAVCLEYADLAIAMLRSVGIPARMPVGYGYSGSLKTSASVSDSLHAWVEAYVPGIGWMTIDPTWGEKFDEFGKADLDHFAFAVWGERDQAPDAVMAGSSDLNYQYEQTTLAYAAKPTIAKPAGAVSVDRYVLFPGLALDRVTVTAQPQIATDNNYVQIDGLKLELGSLAPTERTSLTHIQFGRSWNATSEAKLAQAAGAGPALILAATKAKVNYLPMVVILVLIIGGVTWLVVVRLRPSKPKEPDVDNDQTQFPNQS